MASTFTTGRDAEVALWFDPICPFSWQTARWLAAVSDKTGLGIDWQIMSLAVLNEGRELPAPQLARMRDSRLMGRVMMAIHGELGAAGMSAAYFTFGERYFDQSAELDDQLVEHVLRSTGARQTTLAALSDTAFDALVLRSHSAGQEALGEPGGSPILRIDGHAFFGPVLTSLPSPDAALGLFEAVATLAATAEFTQLQRPRKRA